MTKWKGSVFMNQEVFKAAIFSPVNIFSIIFISGIIYYLGISPITFFVLVIFVIIAIVDLRKKLIIEGDILRFQKVFKGYEVSLKMLLKLP